MMWESSPFPTKWDWKTASCHKLDLNNHDTVAKYDIKPIRDASFWHVKLHQFNFTWVKKQLKFILWVFAPFTNEARKVAKWCQVKPQRNEGVLSFCKALTEKKSVWNSFWSISSWKNQLNFGALWQICR